MTNAIKIDWTEIKSLKLIILPFFLLQLQLNRAKQVLREYILFMISFLIKAWLKLTGIEHFLMNFKDSR